MEDTGQSPAMSGASAISCMSRQVQIVKIKRNRDASAVDGERHSRVKASSNETGDA